MGSENPSDVFRFLVEERVQCCQSRRVRYTQRVDYLMQLPVPIEAASNRGKRNHDSWRSWRSWHRPLREPAGHLLEGHGGMARGTSSLHAKACVCVCGGGYCCYVFQMPKSDRIMCDPDLWVG